MFEYRKNDFWRILVSKPNMTNSNQRIRSVFFKIQLLCSFPWVSQWHQFHFCGKTKHRLLLDFCRRHFHQLLRKVGTEKNLQMTWITKTIQKMSQRERLDWFGGYDRRILFCWLTLLVFLSIFAFLYCFLLFWSFSYKKQPVQILAQENSNELTVTHFAAEAISLRKNGISVLPISSGSWKNASPSCPSKTLWHGKSTSLESVTLWRNFATYRFQKKLFKVFPSIKSCWVIPMDTRSFFHNFTTQVSQINMTTLNSGLYWNFLKSDSSHAVKNLQCPQLWPLIGRKTMRQKSLWVNKCIKLSQFFVFRERVKADKDEFCIGTPFSSQSKKVQIQGGPWFHICISSTHLRL